MNQRNREYRANKSKFLQEFKASPLCYQENNRNNQRRESLQSSIIKMARQAGPTLSRNQVKKEMMELRTL